MIALARADTLQTGTMGATRSLRIARVLARVSERCLELGVLGTILAVPVYFNVDDVRAFEPDKAILLRDLAALLGVLLLLRLTLGCLVRTLADAPLVAPPAGVTVTRQGHPALGNLLRPIWRSLQRRPTILPLGCLALITLLATITSILPAASWHGSYARGQGSETMLAHATLSLVLLLCLRSQRQAQRLVTALALAGVAPAGYGWVQHVGRDPLPWQQADLTARVPGTLGNPIFLGAVLVMTLPLALACLVRALRRREHALAALWLGVVVLEAAGLYFTKSRGPLLGLLVGLAVFGLATAHAFAWQRLQRLTLIVCALAIAGLLAANLGDTALLGRSSDTSASRLLQWLPQDSGSSEVRLEIWGPALQLIAHRPLLGCGPDVILWCYYPVYPTALRHIEDPNAVPDRMHNLFLDAAVETGIAGLAALLAVFVVSGVTLYRVAGQAADCDLRLLAAALLAALAGHAAEGSVGIPLIATTLYLWLIAAAASAMAAMPAATGTAEEAPTRVPLPVGTPPSQRRLPERAVHATPVAGPGRAGWRALTAAGAVCCLVAAWPTWHVLTAGAAATAADNAARAAQDLENAALGNSGQAPLPPGLSQQPILALRQFAAAAQLDTRAVALMPDEETYLLDAGKVYVEWAQAAGDVGGVAASQAPDLYVQGLVDFGAASRLNPYNPDHLRNTGKAYERWAGLGRDPNQPATWNQTLLQRAAQAFARAAQLAPHHPDPLTSRAQVALWQGQPGTAIVLATRALALDPDDGDAYFMRGQGEQALGERQQAVADWRRALADSDLGHRGQAAGELALAEATWDRQRCAAVADALAALQQSDVFSATAMQEIVHVDGPRCPGA
jgi:O-antigen ligase/tetratricopeptide (TPR) repeat protein